jgi:hypothetical protein
MDRVGWQIVDRHEIGRLSGTLQKPGYRPCDRELKLLLPHRQILSQPKSPDQPGLPWEGACSRRLIGRPHIPFGCTNAFASKLPPTMDCVGCGIVVRHEIGGLSGTLQKPRHHRLCNRDFNLVPPHRQILSHPEISRSTRSTVEGFQVTTAASRILTYPKILPSTRSTVGGSLLEG